MTKETISRAEAEIVIEAMKAEVAKRGITVDIQRSFLDLKAERLHVQANMLLPRTVSFINISILEPEK